MHITQLQLENFRGAADLTLNLHDKLNVFYGVNGAGKSTILDAAAIIISRLVSRAFQFHSNKKSPRVTEHDVHNEKINGSIHVGFRLYDTECSSRMTFLLRPKIDARMNRYDDGAKFCEEMRNHQKHPPTLFAYYPVDRAVLDIPLRIRTKHTFGIPDAFEAALTSAVNFRTFFEWFREREDIENENIRIHLRMPGDIDKYLDSQLNAVRSAISVFMPDFKGLTVRRSPLRMEVIKNEKTLRVEQLSDGEKCLMALVGDIGRRLAIANPNSKNPLHAEGVILIDEIDMHLHPTWQHMVVERLGKTFPKCQFLISTHSPHVITHVRPEQLFFLQLIDGELIANHPRESYGKNAEQILHNNMGMITTRPDHIAAELDEIYQSIDTGNLEAAKKKIEQLRNGVNDKKPGIGDDPELVRSSALIKRKELIGK